MAHDLFKSPRWMKKAWVATVSALAMAVAASPGLSQVSQTYLPTNNAVGVTTKTRFCMKAPHAPREGAPRSMEMLEG